PEGSLQLGDLLRELLSTGMGGRLAPVLFNAGSKALVVGVELGDLAILLGSLEPQQGEGNENGDDDHCGHGGPPMRASSRHATRHSSTNRGIMETSGSLKALASDFLSRRCQRGYCRT